MREVLLVTFKNEEQQKSFMEAVTTIANDEDGLVLETFNTPLSAFASEEGPFRIEQLIEDDNMGRPADENLLKEMGETAANIIEDNMVWNIKDYAPIMDGDTLERIAIDSALSVFKDHLETLDEHDRKIAEAFIKDWDNDEE